LGRFVGQRDEGAFALLLARHGGRVWDVCRSLLSEQQDAEDVFQATFLVLAQRPGSVRKPAAIGAWLHGVAYRLAQRVRRQKARKPARTGNQLDEIAARPMEDLTWRELHQALHEELARLPEKNRLPLLLCYMEGRTQDEAARQLGWTAGQVR